MKLYLIRGVVYLRTGSRLPWAAVVGAHDAETAMKFAYARMETAHPDAADYWVDYADVSEVPESLIRDAAKALGMVQPFAERVT